MKFLRMLKNEFKGYNKKTFGSDLLAGITVAAVALPLALAFGVSNGANAAAGLISAIIAGIFIGGLSGTSFQISGPSGAMTAILLPLIAAHGIQGMFIASFLAGIILILAGILKFGNIITFIPMPVITGFTSGIAVIIALGQINNLTGLTSEGGSLMEKILNYFTIPNQINVTSLIIGLSVIAFMIFYPKKLAKFMPSSLAAIIIVTALNIIFSFKTSVVGVIPQTVLLPDRLNLTSINFTDLNKFIIPAISIAALALVESLLCDASAGRMRNEKFDAQIELTALGIGNMIIPFFGGVPATAAIARTSVSIKTGGKTRLVSIIHSIILLLSIFLLSPVISKIPLSALAGVLIVTAWRMNDWDAIKIIFGKRFKGDIFQFSITMIATVVFDLTIAIMLGIIFSVILFMVSISNVQVTISDIDKEKLCEGSYCNLHRKTEVAYIVGPLYFGTVDKLIEKLSSDERKDILILSLRGVPIADMSAVNSLTNFCEKLQKDNTTVFFAGVQPKVMRMFERCGFVEKAGEDKFFWSTDKVLASLNDKCC